MVWIFSGIAHFYFNPIPFIFVFQSLKKALFKPAAFFKGVLLPLCEVCEVQNISGRSRKFRSRGPRTLASFRYSWEEGLLSPALNPPLYPLFMIALSSGTQNRFQVFLYTHNSLKYGSWWWWFGVSGALWSHQPLP